jgi:RNA polymerase sigma factor (sigma-70 family)
MPDAVSADPIANFARLAATRDQQAWESIVQHYANDVYRVSLRVLGDIGEAEDNVQDTFLHIVQAAGRFRPRPDNAAAGARAWIVHLAYTRAVDALRRRRRRVQRNHDIADVAFRGSDAAVAADPAVPAHVLNCALAALPPQESQAITGRYIAGLDYDELARQAGCSVNAIRLRVHRGLARLRRTLIGIGFMIGAEALEARLCAQANELNDSQECLGEVTRQRIRGSFHRSSNSRSIAFTSRALAALVLLALIGFMTHSVLKNQQSDRSDSPVSLDQHHAGDRWNRISGIECDFVLDEGARLMVDERNHKAYVASGRGWQPIEWFGGLDVLGHMFSSTASGVPGAMVWDCGLLSELGPWRMKGGPNITGPLRLQLREDGVYPEAPVAIITVDSSSQIVGAKRAGKICADFYPRDCAVGQRFGIFDSRDQHLVATARVEELIHMGGDAKDRVRTGFNPKGSWSTGGWNFGWHVNVQLAIETQPDESRQVEIGDLVAAIAPEQPSATN